MNEPTWEDRVKTLAEWLSYAALAAITVLITVAILSASKAR